MVQTENSVKIDFACSLINIRFFLSIFTAAIEPAEFSDAKN